MMRSLGLPELPPSLESPQAALDSVPAPWLSVLTKAQRNLGASILFNLYVAEHPRNTSKNIISVLILTQIYISKLNFVSLASKAGPSVAGL
jgi:hypothetical protein